MSGLGIYQYYERVDDRYFIARGTGKELKFIWEPLAKPINITGFKQFDFFILRSEGCMKQFCLCEGLSGTVIIDQKKMLVRTERRYTLKKLTEVIPDLLKKMGGAGVINQAVVNFIYTNDQEISPRYKVIKQ